MARGTGLRWVPVEHDGNTNASVEEAERVCEIWNALVGRSWIDAEGTRQSIGPDDIVIVSPFNAHRARLSSERLPAARVGTVDKFQGQEAPVVDLHDGHVAAGGCAARHGVPLLAQSAERGDVARPGAGHRGRVAAAAVRRPRLAATAAHGQRPLCI